MRAYTLSVSVGVHLIAISAIIIGPLVATTELPEPRRAVEFVEVTAIELPKPPPERRVTPLSSGTVSPTAAPLVAPDAITPDTGIEPSETRGAGPIDGGEPGLVPGGVPDSGVLVGDPVPPPPAPKAAVRVGGAIQPPRKARHVSPVYPALALAARAEGTVILEALIGEDGRIRNLKLLRSIPLLDQAATDAVRQWTFTPTLLNGEPAAVVMTVTVTFTLK